MRGGFVNGRGEGFWVDEGLIGFGAAGLDLSEDSAEGVRGEVGKLGATGEFGAGGGWTGETAEEAG